MAREYDIYAEFGAPLPSENKPGKKRGMRRFLDDIRMVGSFLKDPLQFVEDRIVAQEGASALSLTPHWFDTPAATSEGRYWQYMERTDGIPPVIMDSKERALELEHE